VIDVFLSEHPLDCVTCDKAGACDLQRYAYLFGLKETSYELMLGRTLYQDDNPFFVRDHQYCILCGRCVRVCEEVVGASAIDFVGRGFESHIGTAFDGPMLDSSCVFCGNCVQLCPTASLLPMSRLRKGREWELERVQTLCSYCGVGCQIEYARKEGEILYAQAPSHAPANGEFLCAKGRYGWDFATNPERLESPMIRRDLAHELGLSEQAWEQPEKSPLTIRRPKVEDYFIPVDWETALELVADRLAQVVQIHGPNAVMGMSSARCTNEENYLFQKFLRAGIGTNNIDHCARL
jgi:predicted molibdopterin-dependent oxidoreductase YjgC